MQFLRRASQREVLTVSSRGQITLPAEMRRHFGIEPGGAVIGLPPVWWTPIRDPGW
jgi:hypothetical protein